MTKDGQWSIEELVALTEEVQEGEIVYSDKTFPFQWCELTESEEPKTKILPQNATESERAEWYTTVGNERIVAMIEKANSKNPDGKTLSAETWLKLPATLRYNITSVILNVKQEGAENFTIG
tara:strand:+ start:4737 stop:5102 length:366 start_codon:yes stop_codon:yes gene_type:complete